MAQVGAHTAQGGTCATYTAAGFVRRGAWRPRALPWSAQRAMAANDI